MTAPNFLGLDRDVHGAVVLSDLEEAFGLDLLEEATDRWATVGDIYESLRRLLHEGGKGSKLCATAMALHRLRLALQQLDPQARPGPSDSLRRWNRCSARYLLRQLGRRTRLTMPGHLLSWSGIVGLILAPVAVADLLLAMYQPSLWLLPAGAMILSGLLLILDPGRLPRRCATLGGLARRVAALNFRRFTRMGPAWRDREIWEALVDLLAEHSALPRDEIGPETMLLRPYEQDVSALQNVES